MGMSRSPDIDSLHLLVLTARRGSLSAAAAERGTSQPAASKRISALERLLGVRLFDRSRRGSVLTPGGELIVGWAQRVLDELDVLVDGAEALSARNTPRLSVAASLTLAEHLLPGWLRDLRREDPELRVGLEVTNSRRVGELVRDRVVDIGFIESPASLPGLSTRVVAHDRLVLVVAPSHRWARRRRPVTIAELADTPLVSREEGSGTRETADLALRHRGLVPAPPRLELGSSAAVCSAVLAGEGAALLSELAVATELTSRALLDVPTEGIDLTRDLCAVWPAGTRPTGSAAALVGLAQPLTGHLRTPSQLSSPARSSGTTSTSTAPRPP